MKERFDAQKTASRGQSAPDWATRRAWLDRLRQMVMDHRDSFARAIAHDFGQRPAAETDLAEVFPSIEGIDHALCHGKAWMARRKVAAGRWFWPARAFVQPLPLGVVGVMVPWNYPLYLAIGPITAAFVAGNRVMVKMSEHAPEFAATFARAVAETFDPAVLSVVTGGPEVSKSFAALPFDHLLFTGSTEVGRHVMRAAADHLTPVTLELGGKSPVLVAPDFDVAAAAKRVMAGKMLNAGQTCIAPDYVLLPKGQETRFITAARKWVGRHYPRLADNPDYTRIITPAQYARLKDMLTAAEQGGAVLYPLSGAEAADHARLLPPVAVTGAPLDGALMQTEIFGPILPLIPYDTLDEAVAFILSRPRPLAFYPFTRDRATKEDLLSRIVAGGVSVNETLSHVAQDELPFGGVGASGMGAYHGKAGFDRLSHHLPVFEQARWNAQGWIAPPYGRRFRLLMRMMLGK